MCTVIQREAHLINKNKLNFSVSYNKIMDNVEWRVSFILDSNLIFPENWTTQQTF